MVTEKPKDPAKPSKLESTALYESETLALKLLRLIAAPNPQDDLSDEELAALFKRPGQSATLVKNLIEYIKKL